MSAKAKRYCGAVLAVLLTAAAQSGTASAAIYQYIYSGNVLTNNETGAPLDFELHPEIGLVDRFSGVMWIDESKVPGNTLVSAYFSGDRVRR